MTRSFHEPDPILGGELILQEDGSFSLGQLVLATRLPTRVVYKVQADGRKRELLQYEGTWFSQAHSDIIQNNAHFSRYIQKGPGVLILDQTTDVAVPMTKEELTTLYRFYIPS